MFSFICKYSFVQCICRVLLTVCTFPEMTAVTFVNVALLCCEQTVVVCYAPLAFGREFSGLRLFFTAGVRG